jgi:hypothetical protein
MKTARVILLLVFVLALLPQVHQRFMGSFMTENIAEPSNQIPLLINPLTPGLYSNYSGSLFFEENTLYDRLFRLINPEILKSYEGSYTIDELRADPNNPQSFKLNSSWFFGDPSLPHAGISLQKNPLTGEYEFIGGQFFLPKAGVGMSHEADQQTGESRTFLNIKKSF